MKLLVIEDEKELARSIVGYLTQEGYHCEVAHQFEDAVDKVVNDDCFLILNTI